MECALSATAHAALAHAAGPDGWSDDPADLRPRLTDWRGRTRGRAGLLLRPRDVETVAAIVRAAAAHGVALVPQGGRTGLVGGGLPELDRPSALLSLERMARIRDVDVAGRTLTAEAGVVLSAVHDEAVAVGLRFPLSLAAKGSATVGGLIATNAGGTQVLRHGTMRAQVLGVEAVLPNGAIWQGLSPLHKDNTGYDLKQWLIGAEGTLGIVTAATLRLVPIPPERVVAWAAFDVPEDALAVLNALGEDVESFELLAEDALALVMQHFPAERRPVGASPWHVLVEMAGSAGVADRLAWTLGEREAVLAQSAAQADALWRLRELVPEAERHDGRSVKHDIAVPVVRVADYLRDVTPRIEAAFPQARVFAFGHLGDGNLHYNVRPPPGVDTDAWMAANAASVTRLVHDEAVARGGTISAEHGIGVWKRAEFLRLVDPVKLAAMRAVRAALDPAGIMNSGKLF
ncbi:MAG: FAD-binding oxidoreductase [Sphingomonadaceae bacterium]|nr:FAD-binding oxidoreductase [Sphingomonadaceae bacterium]